MWTYFAYFTTWGVKSTPHLGLRDQYLNHLWQSSCTSTCQLLSRHNPWWTHRWARSTTKYFRFLARSYASWHVRMLSTRLSYISSFSQLPTRRSFTNKRWMNHRIENMLHSRPVHWIVATCFLVRTELQSFLLFRRFFFLLISICDFCRSNMITIVIEYVSIHENFLWKYAMFF